MLCRLGLLISCLVGVHLIQGQALSQETCKDSRRVVGGEKAGSGEHPWQVALDIKAGLCGGSIVASDWILTAAHCFADAKQSSDVRVKVGVNNRKTDGSWSAVEHVVIHDKYNRKTHEHDLALVKFKTPPAGRVIPLVSPEQKLRTCEVLEITGWGRTKEGGPLSQELLKAQIPFVDADSCNAPSAYNGKIRSGMICAGLSDGGVDACQGDSGGPLVLRGPDGPVLIGVVSWGEGCARKLKYGVYTRVAPYRDWITNVIASEK